MTPPLHIFDFASRIRHDYVGSSGYGLAYGSHACGDATPTSDLDLVLVGPTPLTSEAIAPLVSAVRALHNEFDLELDTEVDYEVKLFATFDDAGEAGSLRCFDIESPPLRVAEVVAEPWFLNSDKFRLRLLLNALTSPHVFLGGDVLSYEDHRHRAVRALALLALGLHAGSPISIGDALTAVTVGPSGSVGEDFLGYHPSAQLHSTLRHGLAGLVTEGIISEIDSTHFQQDPDRTLSAIKQSTATWTSAPGTMAPVPFN
ncbi:nucleotidyltransferase domain-containing protein [Nocardia australiensis]|uniref:nucleotidyltransferase domain-containing protein n=1 Tax=Nocardia australiensis TaxID=2887191 RepID=UPI001D14599A|nr:nucleotidyltransferase domain-containing protein [Nocardia australiensis]